MKGANTKRYARMFLNAVGTKRAPAAIGELETLRVLMEKSDEFRGLMVYPMFSSDERTSVLQALEKSIGLSADTVKFAVFLADAGAASAIGEVAERARALHAEKANVAQATVTTPFAIDESHESRINESLRRLTGREVEVKYETDASLVGGMLVKVGSTMYDGSISGQLRLLKDELIKR